MTVDDASRWAHLGPVREQRLSGLGVLDVKRSDDVDCEITTKVCPPVRGWSYPRTDS